MANRQIYQLDTKTLDLTDVIPVQDESGNNEMGKATLQDLQNLLVKQDVQDVTLNGTDTGTTAVLIYGINVVTVSDTNDFCARLPLTPVKGKKVTVINTSNYKARIFPSVDGGKINGVVDGYFDVPADSLPYDFVCYENPNPGYWGTSQRPSNAVSTISTPEIVVHHAGTGATHFWGVDNITGGYYNGFGGSSSGGNLVLNNPGIYKSENFQGTYVAVRAYSNIVVEDFDQGSSDYINITMGTTYLVEFNGDITGANWSGTEGQFSKYGVFGPTTAVPAGTLYSPPEIGDVGTLITDLQILSCPDNGCVQIGINDINLTRNYYTFGMNIPQSLAAKDYKFRFEIDYI
jgi:hypothetical protein